MIEFSLCKPLKHWAAACAWRSLASHRSLIWEPQVPGGDPISKKKKDMASEKQHLRFTGQVTPDPGPPTHREPPFPMRKSKAVLALSLQKWLTGEQSALIAEPACVRCALGKVGWPCSLLIWTERETRVNSSGT